LVGARSGDDAWDYSATVRPSEAAAASAPAPKVATPANKAARKKKKKKQPEEASASNAALPVAAAAAPAAAPETAATSLTNSASDVELGKVRLLFAFVCFCLLLFPFVCFCLLLFPFVCFCLLFFFAYAVQSSALTSIVYPALSQLLEAQVAGQKVKSGAVARLKICFDQVESECNGITEQFILRLIDQLKK
jgi:hypothetical protein